MFKILVSRLLIFAFTLLWVLGLLASSLVWFNTVVAVLTAYSPEWLVKVLQVWYLTTVILISVWATLKGASFVGRWEKDGQAKD